ncbi:MAG: hypothetical protein IJV00_03015 [Clostridia bacterium]|nr:hypothetical protein [Clostridia bacterium]
MRASDALIALIQLTWGFFQSLAGFIAFLFTKKERMFFRRGSLVTRWARGGGLSLGFFVFVDDDSDRDLVAHELGHSVQSLFLGPLYLPVVGLPSLLWAGLPACRRSRRKKKKSYYSFYTERWADRLGGVRR